MADNIEAKAPHNEFDTILVLNFGSDKSLDSLPIKKPQGPSFVYDQGAPRVQFHPKLEHTPRGSEILHNFAINISVGVQGDARGYGYIAIVRAIKTLDFMSTEPYEFDFGLLEKISIRIINKVDGIARVTYDITSKSPGQLSSFPPTSWADHAEQGHI
ncbi:GMP synthase C terminal domain-containing protein [Biscogniauxia marginata]|nr:GMP synthase C terminal domain-containing protein [Biscogniauxia marginata]